MLGRHVALGSLDFAAGQEPLRQPSPPTHGQGEVDQLYLARLRAGLAVTAQLRSLITPDLRILGAAEDLPELPTCSIVLLRNPRSQSPVSEALAEHIVEGFRL